MLLTDNFFDNFIAHVGEPNAPYYYDVHRAKKLDREALQVLTPVNSFLTLFKKCGGQTVTSTEQLTKILEAGTDLFNEPATDDNFMRVRKEKQDAENGIKRDNAVDFFGVRLDRLDSQELETFLQTLRPCFIDLAPPRYKGSAEFPGSGLFAKVYNLKPVFLGGDKFQIKNGELVTTATYAEDRDKLCSRHVVNDDLDIPRKVTTSFRDKVTTES